MKKAPLLQIIAEASTNGDVESLFINTVEAGARLMLEAADAVREAGSMPDRDRINTVFKSMARVVIYSSNVRRAVEANMMAITSACDLVDADLINDLDDDELFQKDKALLELRPTLFNFKETDNDNRES